VKLVQRKDNGKLRVTINRADFEVKEEQVTQDPEIAQVAEKRDIDEAQSQPVTAGLRRARRAHPAAHDRNRSVRRLEHGAECRPPCGCANCSKFFETPEACCGRAADRNCGRSMAWARKSRLPLAVGSRHVDLAAELARVEAFGAG
jgi:hypothetical protein